MTKVSWLIDGWPFDTVNLDCENKTAFGLNMNKDIFWNYRPVPRVEITLSFRPETVPDAFRCNLTVGSRILGEYTFRKDDKGNTIVKDIALALCMITSVGSGSAILYKLVLIKRSRLNRQSDYEQPEDGDGDDIQTIDDGATPRSDDGNGDSVATKQISCEAILWRHGMRWFKCGERND